MSTSQINITVLRNRLQKVIAPAMGWNAPDVCWQKDETGTSRAIVGAVFIEKLFNARYRLVRLTSPGGGERNISDALTNRELMAFMDGLLAAFYASANIVHVRQTLEAWRDNAQHNLQRCEPSQEETYRNQRDNYEALIKKL